MFEPSAGNGLATGANTDSYHCFDQGDHIEKENVGGFAAVVDVLTDGAGGLRRTGAWGRSLCGTGSRAYGLRMSLILACALDRGGMDCSSTDQEVTNEESHVGCTAALWFFPDCPGRVPGIWPIQGPVQWPGVWSVYL